MSWVDVCYQRIEFIAQGLPKSATEKEIRACLRGAGWGAHGGTSHGKKAWSKAVKAYLKSRGIYPVKKAAENADDMPLFGGDARG